jgi:hypothetical protein
MAKDKKAAGQLDAFSEQAMAQAHQALDTTSIFSRRPCRRFLRAGRTSAKN